MQYFCWVLYIWGQKILDGLVCQIRVRYVLFVFCFFLGGGACAVFYIAFIFVFFVFCFLFFVFLFFLGCWYGFLFRQTDRETDREEREGLFLLSNKILSLN